MAAPLTSVDRLVVALVFAAAGARRWWSVPGGVFPSSWSRCARSASSGRVAASVPGRSPWPLGERPKR
jgi:hypothetical protein